MLELKSLLIGLAFSVGVFAVKAGAGTAYFLSRRTTVRRRVAAVFAVGAAYFTVFVLSWYICSRVDVVLYFNRLRTLFESGMTLHLVVAIGLLIWGFVLVRRDPKPGARGSLGWLGLVIPCPVCGSVIFFTAGFLVAFFPIESFRVVLGTYVLFVFIAFVTAAVLASISRSALEPPERTLGYSMLFIASYFVLSVLLVPQFNDIDKVYRLAAYHSSEGAVGSHEIAWLGLLAVVALCAGLLQALLRERNG